MSVTKKSTSEKCYCLYDSKDQNKLYALAYSEEQLKEVTQQYSSGFWFEYDYVSEKFLENERPYKKKYVFPDKPVEPKEKYEADKKEFKWIS